MVEDMVADKVEDMVGVIMAKDLLNLAMDMVGALDHLVAMQVAGGRSSSYGGYGGGGRSLRKESGWIWWLWRWLQRRIWWRLWI